MKDRYLEVTFRKGKALAAYLYLPRIPGAKSARVEKAGNGLLIDYASSGEPIGVEITAPSAVTVEQINAVLDRLGQRRLEEAEWSPLAA
ncbi:MAG: DUF2283 domain-containing protein [Gemmatimonadota bacterium]